MLQFEVPGNVPSSPARRRMATSRSRYPWLEVYLAGMRFAAVALFIFGIGSAAFLLIRGQQLKASIPGSFEANMMLASAVLLALISFWEMVVLLAGTEFIRVMIHIEENTRAIAQQRDK
jgi:hypothetical protein